MKKIILVCFFVLLLSSSVSAQGTLTMETYYPAPEGYYQILNIGQYLHIDAQALPATCVIGDIAVGADDYLYSCYQTNDWQPAGMWNKISDGVIKFHESPDGGVATFIPFVGIGIDPLATFHVAGDGEILAEANIGDGTWATAVGDTYFYWSPLLGSLRAGTIAGGGSEWDEINVGTNSVAFGEATQASGDYTFAAGSTHTVSGNYSTIPGGQSNTITTSTHAVIGGGQTNTLNAGANHSVIVGGSSNNMDAGSLYSFIGGGLGTPNMLIGDNSSIVGGQDNQLSGDHSFIGGGRENAVTGNLSLIVGGGGDSGAVPVQVGNTISGGTDWATIVGGHGNSITTGIVSSGNYSSILGGDSNSISSEYAVILGGDTNSIDGSNPHYSAIVGGTLNLIQDTASQGQTAGQNNFIGGGASNQILSTTGVNIVNNSSILGGSNNQITGGNNNFLGGGEANVLNGNYSVIGGGGGSDGDNNTINGADNAFLGGGFANDINGGSDYSSIVGGEANTVNGVHATILGGLRNDIQGQYSIVGGRHQRADAEGTFQFGNKLTLPHVVTNTANTAFFYPEGGGQLVINTNTPAGAALEVGGNSILSGPVAIAGDVTMTGQLTILTVAQAGGGSILEVPFGGGLVTHQDHAENFPTSDREAAAGDIMIIDSSSDVKLKRSYKPYDKNVAGIVSFSPGLLLEGGSMKFAPDYRDIKKEGEIPLALSGRVMCKVTTENGPIERGDMLTSSSTPGHAMKATDREQSFGTVVGKALEPFNGGPNGESTGQIVVLVTLQ